MPARLALLAVLLALAACASDGARDATPTLHGDAAHPAVTAGWVRTELYFGIGPIDDRAAGIGDADWRAFLDREITPRFPDGLSVFDIYGQWKGRQQAVPERLHSKVVVLLYADSAGHRSDIEAIRAAWKSKTGDLSVLRVTQPADVSF